MQRAMIDSCARVCQVGGFPRSVGQIFGLLYGSAEPMCLDSIAETLQISKASCSLGTRYLCGWRAVRMVWIQGDRKAHFEVQEDFASMFRAFLSEFIQPRIDASGRHVGRLEQAMEEDRSSGRFSAEALKTMEKRVKTLKGFYKRVQSVAPLAKRLF